MDRWDDLRIFLAVVRCGSFNLGARSLGVNQSTVSRRIDAFEERLGMRLFDRGPRGLRATAGAEVVLRHAEKVEAEVAALSREVLGRDLELEGHIRLATADVLALQLSELLSSFLAEHPRIDVSVVTSNVSTNLSRHEADISLRGSLKPPADALGRRICSMGMAVYRRRGTTPSRWVAWQGAMRALDPCPRDADVAARLDSAVLMAAAIGAGVGQGYLACFVGDSDARLERLEHTYQPQVLDLWILTHRDLRETARVRALLRHLAEGLAARRGLFEGQ